MSNIEKRKRNKSEKSDVNVICVLSTFINLSRDNLKKCIDIIMPLYKIFSIPFKKDNISIENVRSALLLFPPKSSLAKCIYAEAVQAELEILRNIMIESDSITAYHIFEKCEEIKHILSLAKNVCALANSYYFSSQCCN